MNGKYYKVRKEYAQRAGLDSRLRTIVDDDNLALSEKDIRLISLTLEERLEFLGAVEITETDIMPATPVGNTPEDDTPEDDTPEVDTPEVDTPEVDTPEDATPEDDTPEDDTPEDDTPEDDTPEDDEN